MKYFLAAFAVVLLTEVCCETDVQCLRRISDDCNLDVWGNNELSEGINFCRTSPKLFRCLKYGLFECNQLNIMKEADKVLITFNEVCKEGTHLNNEFKKHQDCITKTMTVASDCLKDLFDIINDLKNPSEEDVKKFHKEMCKQIEPVKECGYRKIRDSCSKEAEAFFRSLNEPSVSFHKKVCIALDNNVSLMMADVKRLAKNQ